MLSTLKRLVAIHFPGSFMGAFLLPIKRRSPGLYKLKLGKNWGILWTYLPRLLLGVLPRVLSSRFKWRCSVGPGEKLMFKQ